MKKTIIPTRTEQFNFIYLYGMLKILAISFMLSAISFISLAAILFFTGFKEAYMNTAVIIMSILCLGAGLTTGTLWHRKAMLKSSYYINEKKLTLYLVSNCLYAIIIYFIIMLML